MQYRDNLKNILTEEVLCTKKGLHRENPCYVIHCTNHKYVITGPFYQYISGYLKGIKHEYTR